MPLRRLSGPLRVVAWSTVSAAGIGAAYSEMQVWQRGGQALDVYDITRGAMTGAVIGAILTTFDGFVLNAPLSAPLRRAPFAVHVAIKTIVYLGVILFALRLGHDLFPPRGENGSEGGDVLFSLAAAFVFVFILDVNGLLGQNVLINFVTGRYYAPRLESCVPPHRHGGVDGVCRAAWSARLPPPGQPLHRRSHTADRRGAGRNPSVYRR